MSLRPGSQAAKDLYALSVNDNLQLWSYYLAHYQEALGEVAASKKRPDLLELDHFLHEELANNIRSREPNHITHEEIAIVMKWKLARGQMRPLQKVVESNSSISVVTSSTKAFEQLKNGNWSKAFTLLCELRGIGAATASALLCLLDEENCPFMADEVIDVAYPGKRDYNMKIYEEVRSNLMKKAKELNSAQGGEGKKWTAESVGTALWACAKLSMHKNVTLEAVRGVVSNSSQLDAKESKNHGKRASDQAEEDSAPAVESKAAKRRKSS